MGQKAHEAKANVAAGASRVQSRAQEGIKGAAGALGHSTQEAGGKVVSGANWMKEGVRGAAGYVAGEVGSKIETAKEAGARLIEAGRGGLRKLIETSMSSLNRAQLAGQTRFDNVKSGAEATAGKATGGVSRLAAIWRTAKEGVSQKVSSTWEAASVWTNQRRQEISSQVASVQENVDQMLARARNSAGSRIDGFNQAMRSVGEAARTQWDNVSESVKNFASEQAKRVEDAAVSTGNRIRTEVSMAVEKGKIFLAPAWESVQKDRERIRTERNVYGEKLGIMIEGVSDVASPIIDRILDEGRNLRDAALGFSGKHIQGLQVLGRNVAGGAVEVASPAWNFLVERWENLRLRANESRVRLNTFMEAVSGKAGNRFSMLRESASKRAERTSSMLSGVKIEGGRILQNGVEVSKDIAERFAQAGTTAREFFNQRKEQIGQGIDMLRRYWEVYAAGKWKESGLTDIDIKRRIKLLGVTGAASLGRAASLSAAAGIEGAVMLQSLARDRKGQVALTVLALGIALAVNPELRDGLQNMLSNVDIGGIHPFGSGAHLGGVDASAVSMPPATAGVDLGNSIPGNIDTGGSMPPISPDTGIPPEVMPGGSTLTPDLTQGLPPSVPNIPSPDTFPGSMPSTPGPDLGQIPSPDIPQGIPTPGPDMASAIPTPDVAGSLLPNLDMLTPGQSLEAQARQMAGGVNENYYKILQNGFDQFKDNFSTTAQAVVNNSSNYTPTEVAAAQQQLEAVAKLNQDPTLIQGSQGWYDTIMKATHFWRPV